MNIAIDIRPLMAGARTGVGEYTVELINALLKIDSTNQYFLYYNSARAIEKNLPIWSAPNVKIIATKYPNKLFNFFLKIFKFPRLDKLIAKKAKIKKVDVFISPNLGFVALQKNTRHILTIHDLSFEFFPEFFTLKQRFWHKLTSPRALCKRAHLIITPSENTKRDLIDYYNLSPEKIAVIYPALSPDFTPATPEQISNIKKKYNLPEKFFLFLGTIEPRKNIIALIDAYEKIFSSLSFPYQLIIAGAQGWKNNKILIRAKNSPLKDKIKIIGYVAAADKPALYASANIFVYPSFYEGFGFPVLEAIASGVPVITSNRSSVPEITGSAAYLINPLNPLEISGAIKILTTDSALRTIQIQKQLTATKNFSWEKSARQLLALLSL